MTKNQEIVSLRSHARNFVIGIVLGMKAPPLSQRWLVVRHLLLAI